MTPYRRNVLVGITVLGGLVGISTMMLKFGGPSVELFHRGEQVEVEFTSDRADGLAEGAQVLYRGVAVGRITHIRRDDNQQDVVIDAIIDNTPALPSNVTGNVRTVSLVSGIAAISLDVIGGDSAMPSGKLSNHQKIPAVYVGASLIPPEIGQLAGQMRDTKLVVHLDEDVRAAGEVLKGLHDYVNDPKLKGQVSTSLENLQHITESVEKSANNVQKFSDGLKDLSVEATGTVADAHAAVRSAQVDVDRLSKQIDDRMQQISKSLDNVQAITTKVNNGQGTAGLLVNDPKLYQSLVDNSRELTITIADLRRLVEQWEQEGVSFKLK